MEEPENMPVTYEVTLLEKLPVDFINASKLLSN